MDNEVTGRFKVKGSGCGFLECVGAYMLARLLCLMRGDVKRDPCGV